ncbi:MAG: hypothetical protein CMH54_00055 [Myxococcales bacterium]|nr:hypothetical protein [Myxococcales bacterium]
MRRRASLLLLLAIGLTGWFGSAVAAPTTQTHLQYAEVVLGGANPNTPLPMIVAVHGMGSHPDAFAGLFRELDLPARLILPQAPNPKGRGFSWFSRKSSAKTLRTVTRRLADLLTHLVTTRPTVGKPIVTGFSQGGMLSFMMALYHPDQIILAVPIGGYLPGRLRTPTKGATVPVIALHGEKDTVISLAAARDSVNYLKAQGYSAQLVGFPGVAHRIPKRPKDELYKILRQYLAKDKLFPALP